MSGGHWDYDELTIKGILECVANDNIVRGRFPKLSKKLIKLANSLCIIIHDMDYAISGDTAIKNHRKFEKEALRKLK